MEKGQKKALPQYYNAYPIKFNLCAKGLLLPSMKLCLCINGDLFSPFMKDCLCMNGDLKLYQEVGSGVSRA